MSAMMMPKRKLTSQKKPVSSFPLATDPVTGALRERFATGILNLNRGELRRILREIAKISALTKSKSPDKFFQAMAKVLIQTVRYAQRQRERQNKLRRFAFPRPSDEPVETLLFKSEMGWPPTGGRTAQRRLAARIANHLARKPEKQSDHLQTT